MPLTNYQFGITSFGIPVFGSLPAIRGTYFFVDAYQGSDGNRGITRNKPFATLDKAYAACTTGIGDGIVIMSGGTTATNTTATLSAALDWTKHGITMVGIGAPTYQFQRARISNLSTVLTMANLITVSGNNNTFLNLMFINEGSNAAALGGIKATGARNYFGNCHFAGTTNGTPAVLTGTYAMYLSGAEETTFEKCVFGTDTVDMDGSQADTGIVKLGGGTARALFRNCILQSYWSYSNSTCGLVHWVGSGDAITRHVIFDNSIFLNFKLGLLATNDPASVFVGTAPNNGAIILHQCSVTGYTGWDATAANDRVYCTMPVVTAAGGIGVVTT